MLKLKRQVQGQQMALPFLIFPTPTSCGIAITINGLTFSNDPNIGGMFKGVFFTVFNDFDEPGIFDSFRVIYFHDLRNTFASQLIMKGGTLKDVQELLGHKTMTMTLRYAHLSQHHKKKAVNLINGLTAKSSVSQKPDWCKATIYKLLKSSVGVIPLISGATLEPHSNLRGRVNYLR